jgi:spermidine synthase
VNAGRAALTAIILALGGSGIAAQTLLLRELLILFGGNEFSLGVIIGNWLVAGALGALAGGRFPRWSLRPAVMLPVLVSCFSLLIPLTVVMTRLYKPLAGISPDLGMGIGQIFLASLLLLLPVGFCNGLLFVVACALARECGGLRDNAGRVYFLSTVGSLAGGLLTGFLLIPLVTTLTASSLVLLLNGLACLRLWWALRTGGGRLGLAAAVMTLLAAVALLTGGGERLHRFSLSRQWQGKELLA